MTNFCYDMIGAYYAGVNKHPKQDMIDLGFHIVKCQGFPIGDCWYFRVDNEDEVTNIPDCINNHGDFKFPDEEIRKDINNGKEKKKNLRKFTNQEIKSADVIFKYGDKELFRRNGD